MSDALHTALKKLRLSGLLQSLDVRLHEAASHNLSHREFLELIVQDELLVRSDRTLNRRVKAAAFRDHKTLEDFDWSFNPALKKKQVYDLATCRFVRETRERLMAGSAGRWQKPPGAGAGLPGDQGRLRGVVSFDLRRGARLPARRDLGWRGQGAGQVSEARPAHHRRHGHEATAQAFGGVSLRDHHAALRDRARRCSRRIGRWRIGASS